MKWFEEEERELPDSSDSELRVGHPSQIAEIADEALIGDATAEFVHDFFISQKGFSQFLGVGESTITGWMKSKSFPDYAKRAAVAAYYVRKYFNELREAKRDTERPKVVKDGDRYLIVRFETDEVGVSIGKVLARDIPSEKSALVLASSVRAWQLLKDAESLIDHEIGSMIPEDSEWIRDLKDQILTERTRAFAHQEFLETEKERRELTEELRADLAHVPADI